MAPDEIVEPEAILRMEPEQADRLLDRLEGSVPYTPGLVTLPAAPLREAIVFGDSHGDWRSTRRVVARFREDPGSRCLVGLGDYIDRAPDDCEEGSVANALYLLQVAARFSGRVWLIQGNHETFREIPLLPHDLPEEVDLLWGPEEERYHRILHLLERGPLAAISPSGAYLAHGGFPRSPGSGALAGEFLSLDPERLLEIVWGECAAAPTHRADVRPFDEFELARFLSRSRTRVFLRGHDPGLAGRTVYGKRCLTLHTSRLYERFGGVLLARLPLDRPVENADDIVVERLTPDPPPGDPTR